ncbi:Resolvase, N terminal domain [Belnapia rosea]|nr:Resolvase, N terminal domain [Belnapia rosea]
MLIGYMRAGKADGTQALDPQRKALLAAGVDPARLYEDRASGRRDDRPGLEACLKGLHAGATRWSPGSSTGWGATCGTWSTSRTS